MKGSAALKYAWLRSTGRAFSEAFVSLGPEAANSYNRWSKAWRQVVRGRDTARVRATLELEAQRLQHWVEMLPEKERYEAAIALASRKPRWTRIDEALIRISDTMSILLDVEREVLVAPVAATFHNEINDLLRRAAKGASLSNADNVLVSHLAKLKAMTGTEYDAVITDLARESVYQLKDRGAAELRRVSSKVNSLQGAVAQTGFFRSKQFRDFLADRLAYHGPRVRALGNNWTTAVVTEGRIFIATKTQNGWMYREFVDGALVAHEIVPEKGMLARGFVPFSAQVKAEVNVSALPQNLKDSLRATPEWGSSDAILLLPSGKQYRPIQLIQPPNSIQQERMLMAAEGGRWPAEPKVLANVSKTMKVEGPMTRDGCRAIGRFLLTKAHAHLSKK